LSFCIPVSERDETMALKKKATDAATAVLDDKIPWPTRAHLLMTMIGDPERHETVQALLAAAANAKGDELLKSRIDQLNEMLGALEEGALRPATFAGWLPAARNGVKRARVKLPDGSSMFLVVPDQNVAQTLKIGRDVLIDGRLRAILAGEAGEMPTGEVATFIRRIDSGGTLHVSFAQTEDVQLYSASDELLEKIDRGDVKPGATLRVCRR